MRSVPKVGEIILKKKKKCETSISWAGLFKTFKAGLGLVRNLNLDVKGKKEIPFNSFCLQYDDWMIVKVQRKLPAKCFRIKEKETQTKI